MSKDKFNDRGYKSLFSHPKMVEDLIKSFVKEDFVSHFDFSTLRHLNNSFVTEEFSERESDIIWEVSIKGKPSYIYILIEFQSTVDRFMAIRILTYILLLYGELLKDKDMRALTRLPSVLPILLYNGNEEWNAPLAIEDLIEIPFQNMTPYIPHFRYYKIAENEFSPESLSEIKNLVANLFLIETSDMKSLATIIADVIKIMRAEVDPELQRFFGLWLRRMFKRRKIDIDFDNPALDERTVREMLEANLDRYEKEMIEKGKLEGELKGELKGKLEGKLEIARRMKEAGMDKETIFRFTGITESDLDKV